MFNYNWFFQYKNDYERVLMDPFSESKFSTNSVSSFTREIIQNSMDAKDDKVKGPVEIEFTLTKIKANRIPGVEKIKEVLKNCLKDNTKHQETINKYRKALECLEKEEINVLKVSDYNTSGMDDDAWKALLFKVGISKKQNDNSAGRHGVGKKAAFLMSLCNTVLYSTNNGQDKYFGGKTVLVDWTDNEEKWHSGTGWYVNDSEEIYNNPINDTKGYLSNQELDEIDGFFTRKDKKGTDVIIVAPNDKVNDDFLEELIINSMLENFYIGIVEDKITIKINNILINSSNIDNVIDKYYKEEFRGNRITNSNIVYGLLKDYRKAYNENFNNPTIIKINELNGEMHLYLTTEPVKQKKYFAFYRGHGMKIQDCNYSDANKYFSAIAVARGKELNDFLLDLENAAHDDFIIDDNLDPTEKRNKKSKLDYIFYELKNKISEMTKIEYSNEVELEELNDMIDSYGEVFRPNKKDFKPKKVNKKILVQTVAKTETEEKWEKPINPFNPNNEHQGKEKHKHTNRPIPYDFDNGNSSEKEHKVAKEISYEQLLITLHDSYYMDFMCDRNLKSVSIKVIAKNVDDALNDVSYMLDAIKWNDKEYINKGKNYIVLGDLPANTHMKLNIILKDKSRYKLFAKIIGKLDE